MTRRLLLLALSAALTPVMFVLVPWLMTDLGPRIGFLSVFCIYWFLFCLPMGLVFQGVGNAKGRLSFALGKHNWVPKAVLVQTGIVMAAAWIVLPESIPWVSIPIAIAFGLVNGFSEEFFWRGAYLAEGRGVLWFQTLGVVLFGLWHIPIAFAPGITYEGGPVALLSGALALGVFWSVIANKTGSTGWNTVSHIMTNIMTAVGFMATNFVTA